MDESRGALNITRRASTSFAMAMQADIYPSFTASIIVHFTIANIQGPWPLTAFVSFQELGNEFGLGSTTKSAGRQSLGFILYH